AIRRADNWHRLRRFYATSLSRAKNAAAFIDHRGRGDDRSCAHRASGRFEPAAMTDYLRETHHEFLAAASEALADGRLQQILGQLGDTLGRRNREAWAALPNSDLIRERARSIKDATLAELDKHLTKLEQAVTARGGHVHWADDGPEACRII